MCKYTKFLKVISFILLSDHSELGIESCIQEKDLTEEDLVLLVSSLLLVDTNAGLLLGCTVGK